LSLSSVPPWERKRSLRNFALGFHLDSFLSMLCVILFLIPTLSFALTLCYWFSVILSDSCPNTLNFACISHGTPIICISCGEGKLNIVARIIKSTSKGSPVFITGFTGLFLLPNSLALSLFLLVLFFWTLLVACSSKVRILL